MTFNLPLSKINAAQLEALKAVVREGRQLDYKETLPGNSDDDKREFLSDVTSFANAAGGDIIYGVRDKREAGKPTGEIDAITGLPGLNFDADSLRLDEMVRNGIAPRLPVNFHEIRRDPEAPCLLLRVPRSSTGLHMVTYKNLSRFYARTSAGKYQLDVHEIRAGFVAAETAFERLRRFRLDRVARILALETPAPVAAGPKLIVYALPVAVSDEMWARVLVAEESKVAFAVSPIAGHPRTWRFNLDGFVVHTLRDDLSRQCYTQLFRDGGIEAVSGGVIFKDDRRGGFYPWGMEQEMINALSRYQKFWHDFGVAPPLLISITLSGVKRWKVLRTPYASHDLDATFDRDIASAPEVILEDLATPVDVVLRPLFDFVWNGGGWPGSPNYKDGRWFKPS